MKVCQNCADTLPNVCKKCGEKHVLTVGGLCANCTGGFLASQMGMCNECGGYKVVSEERVCLTCFNKRTEKRGGTQQCTTCSFIFSGDADVCPSCHHSVLDTCINCSDNFRAESPEELLCSNCMPSCIGCGNKFQRLDKSQVTCVPCQEKVLNGECIQCSGQTRLDVNGVCEDCRSVTNNGTKCIGGCGRIVGIAGQSCAYCQQAHDSCPDCRGTKKVTQYVCNNCLEHERTKRKRYKVDYPRAG